ncbi:SusD/RagB family nutrient-binding outer membrane lipoprotein [Solitalea canadensis]|nr:SusD/RagB family nutrient-binding outer membrane lipoprotein [Solitalea canadensis]
MKKIYIVVASVIMLTSCIKDDLNDDTKNPSTVPAETIFASAQKSLTDIMTSSNVNRNVFRLITQQWQETTYTDESNYDLTTRNIPQTFWNIMYRDVLKNFSECKKLVAADNDVHTDQLAKTNKLAEIELMEVYAYSVLVNTYGNVPYSQVFDTNNPHPKYDDAKTIYLDLLARIDKALGTMNAAGAGFDDSDIIYGGNASKWIKFGNTLKVKIAMTIVDVEPAVAKAAVEAAYNKGFTSNADNAVLKYLGAYPNTNPIWEDLVRSGRYDFVAAKTIVDQMNTLNDPRRQFYFSTVGGAYKGATPGASSNYDSFSHAGEIFFDPTMPALLLDYSELEFYLAEAKALNWTLVTGTAEEHYNNAIRASIIYWGGSTDDVSAYLSNPDVAYSTAAGNYKQKIGMQKFIALYNRGYDAWTEWRRLDYPKISPAVDAISGIPVRYTYPAQEQNLNTDKYNEASAAIGGDKVETKLFWDKADQ